MYDINDLRKDLEAIPEIVGNARFSDGVGLGGDISFWVFHYPAEYEELVRNYFPYIENRLSNHRFEHIDIFQTILDMLAERRVLDKVEEQEARVGREKLKEMLAALLSQDKIAQYISKNYEIDSLEFLLISGLGSAWPLVRGHEFLSALQDIMRFTPLILFYPGEYDGHSLSPFGVVEASNYYRAFCLNSSKAE